MISIFSGKGNSKKISKRALGMESLENRELLSINPLGYDGADYVQTAQTFGVESDVTTEAVGVTVASVATSAANLSAVGVTATFSANATDTGTCQVYYKVLTSAKSAGTVGTEGSGTSGWQTAGSPISVASGDGTAVLTSFDLAAAVPATSADQFVVFCATVDGTAIAGTDVTSASVTIPAATPTPTTATPKVLVADPSKIVIDSSTAATTKVKLSEGPTGATQVKFYFTEVGAATPTVVASSAVAYNTDATVALTAGKTYLVNCEIQDATGYIGSISTSIFHTVPATAATAPTAVTANSTDGIAVAGTNLTVKWAAVTGDNVAGYKVEVFKAVTDEATDGVTAIGSYSIFSATATTATFDIGTGLAAAGEGYYYAKVTTLALEGSDATASLMTVSSKSLQMLAETATNTVAAPTAVKAVGKDGKITVTWTAGKSTGETVKVASTHDIELSTDGGKTWFLAKASASSGNSIDALPDGTYKVRVVGREATSKSTAAAAATDVTLTTAAAKLVGVKATVIKDAAKGATSYSAGFTLTTADAGADFYGIALYDMSTPGTDGKAPKGGTLVGNIDIVDADTVKAWEGKDIIFTGLNSKYKYEVRITSFQADAKPAELPSTGVKETKISLSTVELKAAAGKAANLNIFGATMQVTDKVDAKTGVTNAQKTYYLEYVQAWSVDGKLVKATDVKWDGTDTNPVVSVTLDNVTDPKIAAEKAFTGLKSGQTYYYRIIEIADLSKDASTGTAADVNAGKSALAVISKVGNFKTPAAPLASIAKTGFGLTIDKTQTTPTTVLGIQLQVKDGSPKTLPNTTEGKNQTATAPVAYELLVSTQSAVLKSTDKTDPLNGILMNSINLGDVTKYLGEETNKHFATTDSNKTAYNLTLLDFNVILAKLFNNAATNNGVDGTGNVKGIDGFTDSATFTLTDANPKAFEGGEKADINSTLKSLQFQLVAVYTDPTVTTNTNVALSKVAKFSMPKFLNKAYTSIDPVTP